MTRDRDRKARIRAKQGATGGSYAEAARQVSRNRQPIEDLLRRAAAGMNSADPASPDAMLRAAWTGLCTIGAAGQLLAACADPDHYQGRWLLAEPVLARAIGALRADPALRGAATAINPAGAPGDRLSEDTAAGICRELIQAASTLEAVLSRAARHATTKGTKRACHAAATAARRAAAIYQTDPAPRPDRPEAAAHPEWLRAASQLELRQVIDSHHAAIQAADPADTAAALMATWYGVAVTCALGQFLSNRDPDLAVLHDNALYVAGRFIEVLQAAPSLPAGVHGVGLETTLAADKAMMAEAYQGIWDLALAVNTLLPQVADHASHESDRAATREGTMLAAELAETYQGRLRTYLNPYRRRFGPGSFMIRGKGHRPPARRPGPDERSKPGQENLPEQ